MKLPPKTPKLILAARDVELEYAWKKAFADVPNIEVRPGDILRHQADAIVSPANSFGFMDGGIDLIYSQHFGWHVEGRVRERILEEYDGELLVGQAFAVPTGDAAIPNLISAPTMRVPMRVVDTAHAYLAFRAVLKCALAEGFATVLCPGLGTGEGRMPASRCAVQMRAAWDAVVEGDIVRKGGLAGAVRHHLRLLERD